MNTYFIQNATLIYLSSFSWWPIVLFTLYVFLFSIFGLRYGTPENCSFKCRPRHVSARQSSSSSSSSSFSCFSMVFLSSQHGFPTKSSPPDFDRCRSCNTVIHWMRKHWAVSLCNPKKDAEKWFVVVTDRWCSLHVVHVSSFSRYLRWKQYPLNALWLPGKQYWLRFVQGFV